MKAARQRLGDNDVRIRNNRYVGDYLLDYLYREESLKKLQDEHSLLCELGLRRFYLGVMGVHDAQENQEKDRQCDTYQRQ